MSNGRINISEFLASPAGRRSLEHFDIPTPWADVAESLPRVTLFRSADLMEIVLAFVDLTIEQRPEGPILRRSDGADEGFLCALFRGQHLHEEAFFESSAVPVKPPGSQRPEKLPKDRDDANTGDTLTQPPVRTRIAARSRLVFRVTDEHFPFTSAGLLAALRTLPLSVAPHAVQQGGGRIVLGLQGVLRPLPRMLAIEGGLRVSGAVQTAGRTLGAAAVMRVRFGDAAAAEVLTAAHSAGGTFELDRAHADELGARQFGHGPVIDLRPPPPREPSATETAVEIPWRLQLSPHEDAGFTHTIQPATSASGRVELWHTRLGIRTLTGVDDAIRDTRTVRAVWARDFTETPGFKFRPRPPTDQAEAATEFPDAGQKNDIPRWRSPLNSRDRMMLVHESSNFRLDRSDGARYTPPSVKVDRLMLSALGGWLTSTFQTTPPRGATTIEEWVHRAALGRDSYVKVVYAGFLLPFGHRASLVKVTERKIKSGIAYLFQRMFVVVREPQRSYGATADPLFDRAMPFTTVQILTDSTPDLDPPDDLSKGANAVAGYMFTPTVGGNTFSFRMLGVDLVGRLVEFDGPLVFAEYDHNAVPDTVQRTVNAFQPAIPVFVVRGQKVAYAPSLEPDDTSLATATMRFDIGAPNDIFQIRPHQAQPRWEPKLKDANTVVPAMSALAGANAGVTVSYPEQYLKSQFTNNPADVYLQLASPAPLNFATQSHRSGGFVAPSLDVTALSRTQGPMGGPAAALFPGSPGAVPFDIKKFFASSAKLFGLVTLGDLVTGGLDTASLPRFVAQSFDAATMLTSNMEQLQALAARLAATVAGPVSAQLQGAATAATAAINAVAALAPASGAPPIDARMTAAVNALTQLTAQLPSLASAVATEPSLLRADREALSTMTGRLSDQLGSNADQIGAVVDLAARAAAGEALPETMRSRLDWTTDIQSWPPADPNPIFAPTGGTGKLTVAVDIQAPTCPGGEPSALVSCALSPFELRLIGKGAFVTLSFDKIEFSAVPGCKTDVNVEFGGIKFGGPLQFVETLRSIIPLDGFSDPPYLDVTPSGIRSGFDLPIPNVAMGIFALTNINLSAAFEVPFIGESIAVRFGFSTRESPFRLQVSLFAGGGFFGIVITPKEVRELEAALEFGAAVALNFGVASGSVSVMAGIYFRLRIVDGATSAYLTGYFRARGEVDVLGLITACIEIYLELTYETASGKAVGRASISVEVSVCMLSFSVSIEVEKKFAGSAGDPTFAQVMGVHPALPGSPRPWDEYCDAFAD